MIGKVIEWVMIIIFIVSVYIYASGNTKPPVTQIDIHTEETVKDSIISHSVPSVQIIFYVEKYAKKYNIPSRYALRCIHAETGYTDWRNTKYNPSAKEMVSTAGALGPCQVTQIAARAAWGRKLRYMTKTELIHKLRYDIEFNVETSMRYLALLHRENKNWVVVFSVYNQGQMGKHNINSYARKITS